MFCLKWERTGLPSHRSRRGREYGRRVRLGQDSEEGDGVAARGLVVDAHTVMAGTCTRMQVRRRTRAR